MTSLESFRNEWRNEITGKKESDAIDLWLQAEAYEADGDLGKAINLYSRAEKLDEDVFTKVRQSRPERVKPVFGGDYEKVSKSNVDEDLQKNLQSLKISSSISSGHHFDKPDFTAMTSSKPSLVDFPTEVIQKIMKRLACSGHLISIGKLSLVCKFLHNQAEDDSLWKLACRNFFDAETLQELYELNGNYKTCYLKTPKPNLSDGVYVGKQSYWREGEQRGWTNITQHVTYRRYLRFFPDNYIVVVCSAEEPKFIMRKIFSNANGLKI
ncbi:unnamed protein product [Oikopleura dioica]|uniref:F-box domain-containing protein n=1 Tax=Oikopleura dioica TaxID=34765 RepID=E4X200_OIKDI|nr:unnamed protein product [Oikopleura dioica]CBY23469.1 unnamed protein product [Oikopleura dioica]